ncbi:MAG: diaminopimelate decarboxylase family protein, partial [Thermodesulfobacteriota bacterium]
MWYDFQYKGREYRVEDVSVKEIVEAVGTPCYIYSNSALEGDFDVFREAFSEINPLICFSVKANSNLAVLRTYANLGIGFDVVSGGELLRVLRAGGDPGKIVFSGVGKTEDEIKAAIGTDILFFNVESVEELHVINDVAKGLGKKARIALRVNPDIDPKTHPYIS